MSEIDEARAADDLRKKGSKGNRKPKTPSLGAQNFLNEVKEKWTSIRDLRGAMIVWLRGKGQSDQEAKRVWRRLGAFLRGGPDFSDPQMLVDFIKDRLKTTTVPEQFLNARGLKNFAADFVSTKSGLAFVGSIRGSYRCFRPALDVLFEEVPFEINKTDDVHKLELVYHGDHAPGTFSYVSETAKGAYDGAWDGYVLTKFPWIFLVGFCRKAHDVAYFLLRNHPQSDYSEKILVGVQSLLVTGKRAVSRPIAAVKQPFLTELNVIAESQQWIEAARKKSGGAVIDLADLTSGKT